MDTKFGYSWNVVCGEFFSMSITYQDLLYLFLGSVAILIWRSSNCLEKDVTTAPVESSKKTHHRKKN